MRKTDFGTSVYAILLIWPDENYLYLKAPVSTGTTVITMLGYPDHNFGYIQLSPTGINITLPTIPFQKMPSMDAWVFKLISTKNILKWKNAYITRRRYYFMYHIITIVGFVIRPLLSVCVWGRGTSILFKTNLVTFLCLSQARTWTSNVICRGTFLLFNDLRWEVVVRFCYYWWDCWPSLFKLPFHNVRVII